MPTAERVVRTDTGLASALGVSVARLSRRLRSERLAQRLRELSPDDRAVRRRAAPILERRASA